MGLFCLPDSKTIEGYIKAIRSNLELYEEQCHEYQNTYLLTDFIQTYLDELIKLDKELPTNHEWNMNKTNNKDKNETV